MIALAALANAAAGFFRVLYLRVTIGPVRACVTRRDEHGSPSVVEYRRTWNGRLVGLWTARNGFAQAMPYRGQRY